MTLKWDYKHRTCNMSMPGYVSNVLSNFQHEPPKHPQHTPSRYVTPIYGANNQYATKDETPPLTAKKCFTIHKVTGSAMYYAHAVDPTVLMPLNDISTEQPKANGETQAATNQMLDYLVTHPDATIRYHAPDMILHIHIDASYLLVSHARSRLGGMFFFGNKLRNKIHLTDQSSTSRPQSKTWWPPLHNQKLARAFTTPKVAPHSESHSPSWATHNPRRLSAQINPLHSASLRKQSNKNDLKQ
jgi:hypothetical protein